MEVRGETEIEKERESESETKERMIRRRRELMK